MQKAGFILTGGHSSRMGKDKALLPWRNTSVVEHLADLVRRIADSATLIGSSERYKHLGLPCVPDLRPQQGPLAGLETALSITTADWNLIVACDLPTLAPSTLSDLLQAAESGHKNATIVRDAGGRVQPLCGVYHRCCCQAVQESLNQGNRKVFSLLEKLEPGYLDIPETLANVNTPEEWNAVRRQN